MENELNYHSTHHIRDAEQDDFCPSAFPYFVGHREKFTKKETWTQIAVAITVLVAIAVICAVA